MAYQPGFTYVAGPKPRYVLSAVSSTATFKGRNPVSISSVGRTVRGYDSADTAVFGIACHDAATSFAGPLSGMGLFEIPRPGTIYATAVQTGVATSKLSAYQGYSLEKSGLYWRVNTDSQATPPVMLVPREDGSICDSTDSSVWVEFYLDKVLETSGASVPIAS